MEEEVDEQIQISKETLESISKIQKWVREHFKEVVKNFEWNTKLISVLSPQNKSSSSSSSSSQSMFPSSGSFRIATGTVLEGNFDLAHLSYPLALKQSSGQSLFMEFEIILSDIHLDPKIIVWATTGPEWKVRSSNERVIGLEQKEKSIFNLIKCLRPEAKADVRTRRNGSKTSLITMNFPALDLSSAIIRELIVIADANLSDLSVTFNSAAENNEGGIREIRKIIVELTDSDINNRKRLRD